MEDLERNLRITGSKFIPANTTSLLTTQNLLTNAGIEICKTASVQLGLVERATFPLLSLPLELRRMVYHHYFTFPIPIISQSRYRLVEAGKYCSVYCLKKCNTDILTINRQVRVEARDVLFRDTIWHFSFNSFASDTSHEIICDASLRAFASRPEFQFVQHVTVGVMFRTARWSSNKEKEDRDRFTINRKLLKIICKVLILASNLRTLKLIWHDRIGLEDWKKKQDCLRALARLPPKVTCTVSLGREAPALHSTGSPFSRRLKLSAQEQAAKADLNRYLNTMRQQYQASSRRKSEEELENTSSPGTIEQSSL